MRTLVELTDEAQTEIWSMIHSVERANGSETLQRDKIEAWRMLAHSLSMILTSKSTTPVKVLKDGDNMLYVISDNYVFGIVPTHHHGIPIYSAHS